jgi:diguanylate cyclase (GGDEF)-like protein/PAS domain S-box-containing protein
VTSAHQGGGLVVRVDAEVHLVPPDRCPSPRVAGLFSASGPLADQTLVRHWWWRGYLVVSVTGAGAYFALPDSPHGRAWLFVALSVLTLVAVVMGLRINRPERPLAWGMLAVGQSLNVVGIVVWYLYPTLSGSLLPFPSVADVLLLGAYGTMAVGLSLFSRRGGDRVALLDAGIITVGVGVVSWVFLMAPNLHNDQMSVLDRGVTVAYPLADVLLLALLARVAIGRRIRTPALLFVLLWMSCQFAGDSGFTLTQLAGTFRYGHPLFAGWLMSYAFLGAAALHPSMRTLTRTDAAAGLVRRGRLPILMSAALLAPAVAAVNAVQEGDVDRVVAALAGALLLLLVFGRVAWPVGGLRRTDARLSFSESRLAEAQALAQVGSWSRDLASGTLTWSVQMYRIAGLDPGTPDPYEAFRRLVHPEDRPPPMGHDGEPVTDDGSFQGRCRITRPDGQLRVLDIKGEVIPDAQGRPNRVYGTVQDITDHQHAQELAGRLASIVEFSQDAIYAVTLDGTLITWNVGAQRLLGYPASEIIGRSRACLLPPGIPDDWPLWSEQIVHGGAIVDHDTVRLHRDGTVLPVALTVSPIRDGSGRVTGASLIARDITERKELEEQLIRQALHDPLTGLANRALLHDRVVHALSRVARSGERLALLFVDLDDFKLVNDSLGHDIGDKLLVAVARRLQDCVRAADTVARLGGDEFAIVLEGANAQNAAQTAERILAAMRSMVDLDGVPVRVRASIGVAHHYDGTQDVGHLLRGADIALYAAKRNGKGGYQLFEPTMQAEVTERLKLDADLRHAIDIGQFRLQYQPIIALATEQTVGFEALLRWNRPERGPLPPDAFIPILEENGLIVPVGQWVLREACEQNARWRTRSGRPWSISVNVSPRQLRDPGFIEHVRQALAAAALPPSALILEITEGVMVTDVKHTIDKLNTLKDLGVRIAVDDFGTGYSSLRYLQTLPVNSVKLDRSFIAEIQNGPRQAALAEAIVKVGQALHLTVVAEGIETAEQLDCLRAMDCEYGQGFYFARPQDPATIDADLARLSIGVR